MRTQANAITEERLKARRIFLETGELYGDVAPYVEAEKCEANWSFFDLPATILDDLPLGIETIRHGIRVIAADQPLQGLFLIADRGEFVILAHTRNAIFHAVPESPVLLQANEPLLETLFRLNRGLERQLHGRTIYEDQQIVRNREQAGVPAISGFYDWIQGSEEQLTADFTKLLLGFVVHRGLYESCRGVKTMASYYLGTSYCPPAFGSIMLSGFPKKQNGTDMDWPDNPVPGGIPHGEAWAKVRSRLALLLQMNRPYARNPIRRAGAMSNISLDLLYDYRERNFRRTTEGISPLLIDLSWKDHSAHDRLEAEQFYQKFMAADITDFH